MYISKLLHTWTVLPDTVCYNVMAQYPCCLLISYYLPDYNNNYHPISAHDAHLSCHINKALELSVSNFNITLFLNTINLTSYHSPHPQLKAICFNSGFGTPCRIDSNFFLTIYHIQGIFWKPGMLPKCLLSIKGRTCNQNTTRTPIHDKENHLL